MFFLPFSIFKQRKHAHTIHLFDSSFWIKKLFKSRHKIPKRTHKICFRTRLDMSRPGNNHRHTNSSLIQIAFITTPDTITIKEIRISSPFSMRPVITGEDNNRIIVYSLIFQLLYQLTNVYIEPIDHCSKCSTGI